MRRGTVPLVAVVMVLAGCGGADPALVSDLEDAGVPLYAPEVRGRAPVDVGLDQGRVVLSYAGLGTVTLERLPDGPLCGAVDLLDDSDCTESDGVLRSDFEEQSVVAVDRGDVVLVARGLVTEADPTLADDVAAALREAPEVSAEELAGSVD